MIVIYKPCALHQAEMASMRSWCETADCSMPMSAASRLTEQGSRPSLARINNRLGAASACGHPARVTER